MMSDDRKIRRKHDAVQGAMELGPRSLALLRRMCLALEMLANNGQRIPDLGKPYEDDTIAWPDPDLNTTDRAAAPTE